MRLAVLAVVFVSALGGRCTAAQGARIVGAMVGAGAAQLSGGWAAVTGVARGTGISQSPSVASAVGGVAHAGETSLFSASASGLSSGSVAWSRSLIDSFAAPGSMPMGIDTDPLTGLTYHIDEAEGQVYSISDAGGATELWRVSAQIGHVMAENIGNGLCHVRDVRGEFLYVTDYNGHSMDPDIDRVYRFTVGDSSFTSWDVDSIADRVIGICFDGDSFWLSSKTRGELVRCDTSFQEIESFQHPTESAGALDYDPVTGCYYVTDYVTGKIYVCDAQMSVLDSFFGHPTAPFVAGLAIGASSRGRVLWTSSFGSSDPEIAPSLFVVDDVYYNETPVKETSWTSLKMMYR